MALGQLEASLAYSNGWGGLSCNPYSQTSELPGARGEARFWSFQVGLSDFLLKEAADCNGVI